MTTLTEQWQKGELSGDYWCEITLSPYPEQVYLPTCDNDIIVEVLAPVLSFKEWQKLTSDCKTLARKILQAKPELRGWLETNYGEYVEQQKDWVNGI